LREAAQDAGLTVTQLKLLNSVGAKVGLTGEGVAAFVTKLTVNFDELRQGGGELFNQLARIDTGLISQLANAKDTASAIDILAKAYARATDQAQRNTLAKAIGGKSGIAGGQLLEAIAAQGGLRQIESDAVAAGKAVDERLVNSVADLKVQIEETRKRIRFMTDSFYAEPVLQRQLQILQTEEKITRAVLNTKIAVDDVAAAEEARAAAADRLSRRSRPSSLPPDALARNRLAQGLRAGGDTSWADSVWQPAVPAPGVPLPTARPTNIPQQIPSAVSLALMQRWTSVLGSALTPSEQLKLRTLELAKAQEEGALTDGQRARALDAFKMAQQQAAVSIRERLGIATEEESTSIKLRELNDLESKGYIKNATEKAAAARLVAKETKEAADAAKIRASDTPNLLRLSIESRDLRKQLDQNLSSSLRTVGDDMIDMAMGTKTAADGLKDMTLSMGKAVAQAVLMKNVIGPMANLLSSGLGSLFGASTGGEVSVTKKARGGIIHAAGGGAISGPGSSTSDSILARLSDGEYVVNARSTAKYRPLIEAINTDRLLSLATGGIVGFAGGGDVTAATARMVSSSGGSSAPTINLINNTGTQFDKPKVTMRGGSIDIELKRLIVGTVAGAIRQGDSDINSAQEAVYGSRRI
jgi:hypothetical protein